MGHNEDQGSIMLSTTLMVHGRVTNLNGAIEQFIAFCYPGKLCGNAFGINLATRTVVNGNTLFPKDINPLYLGMWAQPGTFVAV